ncbi:Uma2 family endonuclease [Streptomyces sp. SKN60]|uniref:Uma2 family endonuclease n=1 Tax=Streptomyces sp. SKN60 TaxID=2855506 RepID=UPI0022477B14|nr:Uma2 family endonuclease [Streptomyces sp. SKN60]
MTQEFFEEFARTGDRLSDALRLEFIAGRIEEKARPDGNHGRIIQWLTRLCIEAHPQRWLYVDQGLHVETYRKGNARPDGCLAPSGTFVGQGEWASPDGVLMAVEVTSHDSDTDRRDRVEKPRAYAESGIPVYLLIDRAAGEVLVHSQPGEGRYDMVVTVTLGKTVTLPDPVGMELDTEPLTAWVD